MRKMLRMRFTVRRLLIIGGGLVLATAAALLWRQQADRVDLADAARREAPVRQLLEDAPLANLRLPATAGGLNPFRSRSDGALARINPIHRAGGLTRPAGPTIDACRAVPGGVPAELLLRRGVPVPDRTQLGPYSSRSVGDVGNLKGVEFFTYGRLDVGVKEGAIVVVRVR